MASSSCLQIVFGTKKYFPEPVSPSGLVDAGQDEQRASKHGTAGIGRDE
jgi:hypothetical protein